MQGSDFDEEAFFWALSRADVRALLIGRRALVALGLPVLTADYDFWLHADDVEALNGAASPFGLVPNRPPAEARNRGRYVLENDEHVDVVLASRLAAAGAEPVAFDDVWARRRRVDVGAAWVSVPDVPDLVALKRLGGRPKDLEDIRLLERLIAGPGGA